MSRFSIDRVARITMSMNTPQISVVMAVHNTERFLRQAMGSILNQTYSDFELIVVDDASSDGSSAILDSYDDPRIVRITNGQNLGLTRSLNRGLSVAHGEFIARHDADDVSHPERFRQQLALITTRSTLGLVTSSYDVIDRHGQLLDTVPLPTSNSALQTELERYNCFCHGAVMFRRDCAKKIGCYYCESFPVAQDYDLWLRIAEHHELGSIAEPLYQWRFDSEGVSQKKTGLQLAFDQLARDRARQRRAGNIEPAVPDDVLGIFPPRPLQRLQRARRAAYLLYTAGQLVPAGDLIIEAHQVFLECANDADTWPEWTLAAAHRLASLRGSVDEGVRFIAWVLEVLALPRTQRLVRQVTGRFYADQAFLAYENQKKERVPSYTRQAVRYDWRWLRNRGLLAITLRSLGDHEN
jgi:glycosyltransferase involved in cell wall biosynthesis